VPDRTVAGANIHYETNGAGTPLVLLHGIGSNSRSWHRQLEVLSSDFNVIAWDAPGYGRSADPAGKPAMAYYARVLCGLLDELGLSRIHLLGHSAGGVVAQEFYRLYPERVMKLILADTTFRGSRDKLEERLGMIRSMTPAEVAVKRAPMLLTQNAPPELFEETVAIMSEIRPAGYEFASIALAQADTRDVLRNLNVPTLLIWGMEDAITPLWRDLPEGARLAGIPYAGHLCYAEQPDLFNAIVREFLREDHRS
jgi:pimeloyl-ACP methyl ester carboxylesterase